MVGWTIVHWIVLINTTTVVGAVGSISAEFDNPEQFNETISNTINFTSYGAMQAFIMAIVLTVARLLIQRVRKSDKNWTILDILILTFCMLSVVFSQYLVKSSILYIG